MLIVSGARVLDPSQNIDEVADLLVENGRVVAMGRDAGKSHRGEAIQRVEAKGLWLTPGFVDLHVHFREPGHEYKEDIFSGQDAAARGGFTTVCPMPNTRPCNDTRAVTELMIARSKERTGARVLPFASVTVGQKGEHLTEMSELKEAGAIGVSDDGVCVMNAAVMRRALQYASGLDLLVSQHCEDHHLTAHADMHEGRVSASLGLRGWPRKAESIIVARDILLNERIRARYHVAHISTMGAAALVREAKSRNIPVTTEVTPHHLLLNHEALLGYNTSCKMNPPLREEEDVEAMIRALADGTIDCIATDHAPHSALEKDCEFSAAAPGLIGLETAFPLLLELVRKNQLKLSRLIEALTISPAKVARLEAGTLKVGSLADFILIDPEREWTVEKANLGSKSVNTPWLKQTVRGACVSTYISGTKVFER